MHIAYMYTFNTFFFCYIHSTWVDFNESFFYNCKRLSEKDFFLNFTSTDYRCSEIGNKYSRGFTF